MRRNAAILITLLLTLTCWSLATQAEKAARPTTEIDQKSCVTAECHAGVKAYKAVHAPVQMNACDTCHELDNAKKHTFALKRQDAALCTYCHEFDVRGIPVVHKPVAKGECVGCHDPHGGTDTRMMREDSVKALCSRCHDSVTMNQTHVHKPVAEGSCESCHTSHASRFPKLLYSEGEALCMSCHQQFESQLLTVKFRHQALKEGCTKCHSAHASQNPNHLVQATNELCVSCHEDVKKEITQSKYKHNVVTSERGCMTCHTAHGSDLAGLMNDLPIKICTECHVEKVKTDRGTMINALPELVDPKSNKHGPIRDGQCGSCHKVHGANEPLLLVKSNAGKYYQKLAEENYQLCFDCHDMRLGTEAKTTSATRFRNGDMNLHALHADDGNRGRNCRICHSTHASYSAQHVNDSVQYGKWKMPIGFRKTATGGTCSTGCHIEYPYDRENPAPRPTTRPTTRTVIPAPAQIAEHGEKPVSSSEKPVPIKWALTSAMGESIAVPHLSRPTVLVFLRTGHSQHQQMMRLISAAVPDLRKAQVILILGGENAVDEAMRMSQGNEVPWPVVADSSGDYFSRQQVHVWPTTIVLNSDGEQIARLSGAPEALAIEIAAYVDFAAGRINQATLTSRLASHLAAGDSPQKLALRLAHDVQRLLSTGSNEKARRLLQDALKVNPELAPLKVEAVRLFIQMNQPARARELLENMPADALPPGQKQVLLARVLIKENKLGDASTALASALGEDPRSREAHFLLGFVYEVKGDWQNAARAYRAAHEAK